MREIRGQFQTLFRTQNGNKFFGELGIPSQSASTTDFQPRRSLTVSKRAMVEAGNVVFSDTGNYLLSLQSTFSDTVQFKCFEVTHRVSWSRKVDQVDPVTGLARDSHLQIIDPALPVIVEYGNVVENIGIETDTYRILTGADVKPGDRLGAWIVQSRKEALGLHILEVS